MYKIYNQETLEEVQLLNGNGWLSISRALEAINNQDPAENHWIIMTENQRNNLVTRMHQTSNGFCFGSSF